MGEMADYILDQFALGPDDSLCYDDTGLTEEEAMQVKVDTLRRDRKGFRSGETWYSCNWELDQNVRGATVEFTYKENGQWKNVDQGSFKVVKAAEPYTGGRKGGGSSNKGGGYDNEGQRRGNALTNATSIVCALITTGKVESGKEAAQKAVAIANYLLKEFVPNTSESAPTAPVQKPVQAAAPEVPAPRQEFNDDLPF